MMPTEYFCSSVLRIRGKFGENPSQPSLPSKSEYPPGKNAIAHALAWQGQAFLDMKGAAVFRSYIKEVYSLWPGVGSLRFFAIWQKGAFLFWRKVWQTS
jgi:hypothetical protein